MKFCWDMANSLDELESFHEQLRRCLAEAGCSDEAVGEMELVTEELLVNMIRYGYDEGESDRIRAELWAESGEIRLLLDDGGRAFDPLQAEERPEDKVGGWGIPLIRALMQEFQYERRDGRNRVRLVRREGRVDPLGEAAEKGG